MVVLFKKLKERKRKEIISTIMPEEHFCVLEQVVKQWNNKKMGLIKQSIVRELYEYQGENIENTNIVKTYIEYLHARGYVFCNSSDVVIPTQKGINAYNLVHKS